MVVARRRLAQDDRTTELVLAPECGSWRSIQVTLPGRDKGAASAEAICLLREVLGDAVTGELWVEETNEAWGTEATFRGQPTTTLIGVPERLNNIRTSAMGKLLFGKASVTSHRSTRGSLTSWRHRYESTRSEEVCPSVAIPVPLLTIGTSADHRAVDTNRSSSPKELGRQIDAAGRSPIATAHPGIRRADQRH